MVNKTARLRAHLRAGDHQHALAIAARWQLGDDTATVQRAHQACWRPGFYRQLGHDPDQLIAQGVEVLRRRFANGRR